MVVACSGIKRSARPRTAMPRRARPDERIREELATRLMAQASQRDSKSAASFNRD
jgi:hypothetical protein